MSARSATPPGDRAVYVVDDDGSSREAMARVLRLAGYDVRTYAAAAEFLERLPDGVGCLVLDLRLPGPSGIDLQTTLAETDCALSIVFVSGHGDVPQTAHAMKQGAVDFLAKPVDAPVLVEAVRRAVTRSASRLAQRDQQRELQNRYDALTPREREVFAHVVSGQLNKQIAYDLGTAVQTVKLHRARVMSKLRADSVADLVRFAGALGVSPIGRVREPKV
jgi:FixJ family two-component response regulator